MSALARKLYRNYGLTWCQWKGAVKLCLSSQTCSQTRPNLASIARSQCTHVTSDILSDTQTPSSESSASTDHIPNQLTERGIGKSCGEQDLKLLLKPDQPPNAQILRVAVIGLPNSGKSTLTNSLMGWRVSSVSKKVHTTRKNTVGIYTQDNKQIVFLDTPGILSATSRKRHNLEKSLVIDPERSLHQADLVCVLVDMSDRWRRNVLDPLILQVLHLHQHIPAVLVLNKVDLLQSKELLLQVTRTLTQGIVNNQKVAVFTKSTRHQGKQLDKERLFDAMGDPQPQKLSDTESHEGGSLTLEKQNDTAVGQLSHTDTEPEAPSPETDLWTSYFQRMQTASRAVREMKGWPHFKRVFMVSALSGDGVDDMKDYLLQSAKPGDWEYHSSLVTAQDPREVVLMCVREKLLEHLKQEMPYTMGLEIVLWEVDEDGMFNVIINITTQNRRQMSILVGPQGKIIQKIASEAKQEMMNAFRCEMRLKLIARAKFTQKR